MITIFFSHSSSPENPNSCSSEPPRSKHEWPFSCDSIWNTPIGSDAQYVEANIGKAEWVTPEINYYIVTSDNDPVESWYFIQNWGKGRCELGGEKLGELHVPENLIVADATELETPNNATAFLDPDGQTLIQITAFTRCQPGGPIFGYPTPRLEDIYGPGITGGQGGSGLSSIGGTIRLGELLPSAPPIRHTLKLLVYANKYLYQKPPGYRWPAIRSDQYAFDPNSDLKYGGNNPNLVMGSLLAIPPDITEESLGLNTIPGRKLFHALQDYGGYIVDDTAWDSHAIAVENGVEQELLSAYNHVFGSNSGLFYEDINTLFQALFIVNNNDRDNVGGGGQRRQPLAPPLPNDRQI